jgi:hypothetical protein
MPDASALIEKHIGKGVFVDANLLVLLLVGSVNPKRIATFKRTQNFSVDDFRTLRSLVAWLGPRLIATPHVLSQVSDLTDLSGPEAARIRQLLKTILEIVEEKYDAAKVLAAHRLFDRFGLGDASVAAVCERGIVVLTADVQLQVALSALHLDAINFNHVRTFGWRR